MTQRLYFDDATRLVFEAEVLRLEHDGTRVELDRSAFYPTGGGQPHDLGTLDGIEVIDVVDEDTRVVHVLARALEPTRTRVVGQVDAERRRDHTQQHSAQHLLSAILEDHFDRPTASFHLGAELSTIDLDGAPLAPAHFAAIERRVFDVITADLRVSVSVHDSGEMGPPPRVRRASERAGPVRVVSIEGIDVNACGGTHIRSTGELGAVLLVGVERLRNQTRLSFVAGHRALRRMRADATLLAELSAAYGTAAAPAVAQSIAQRAQLGDTEKAIRALTAELGRIDGTAKYHASPPDASGRRIWWHVQDAAVDERVRAATLGFTAGSRAIALAASESARTILLVASADCGLDVGRLLKSILSSENGRGGGNVSQAQGTVPDAAAFARAVSALRAAIDAT